MIELDKIYNGDCLELMKDIPDGSVDMICCDLPYGTTRNTWDSVIPMEPLWEQYLRVTKRNAAIVLFSQQPFTSALVMSNPRLFRYEWIWQKEQGTGFLNAHRMPLKEHENILVFYRELPVYNPVMRKGKPYKSMSGGKSDNYEKYHRVPIDNKGERFPSSVLYFQHDKEKTHPTQKPVNVIRYLIQTYTNKGDVVLDSCSGSGSTAIACIRENRHFIGMELDERYWNMACERIEKERSQLTLGLW